MKRISVILLLSASLLCSCSSQGSSDISRTPIQQEITIQQITSPHDIHSPLQRAYLDGGDPEAMDNLVADGKHENSKPIPLTLSWEGNSEAYEVHLSESESFEEEKTYAVKGNSLDITNLKIGTRYFYKVTSPTSSSGISSFLTSSDGPRNIDIDGVTNVRDVGGWSIGGGKIKQGLLYRGARLNDSYPEGWVKGGDDTGYQFTPEITEKGQKTFHDELGIITEIDMRVSERNGYPGLPPEEETYSAVNGVNYIPIPTGGSANINQCKPQIKQVFDLFADISNYPMYFHCNIGTDRTGMITFLLNAYLGVNEIDLQFDYLFSNFGLIALPNAYSSDPTYKKLSDLTKPTGAAGVVSTYPGNTFQEKATNCLLDCGISEATLLAIKDILVE